MALIIQVLLVFIATSLDYLFLLMLVFHQVKNKSLHPYIYVGQVVATFILLIGSLLISLTIQTFTETWMTGFLGIIPIILAIKLLVSGEEEVNEEDVNQKLKSKRHLGLIVCLLTLASGGDNLAVYVPFFSSIHFLEVLMAMALILILTLGQTWLSYKLSRLATISNVLEKVEAWLIPTVLFILGLYILWESGSFSMMYNIFF